MLTKLLLFLVIFFILSTFMTALFIYLTRRAFTAINELTPDVDEIKEILRNNTAVAQYFSRILSSFIIGLAILLSSLIITIFSIIK